MPGMYAFAFALMTSPNEKLIIMCIPPFLYPLFLACYPPLSQKFESPTCIFEVVLRPPTTIEQLNTRNGIS